MVGKTTGQVLLYTDWKCFENSSATLSSGINAYHRPQAGWN
jgi:hypothetical protein